MSVTVFTPTYNRADYLARLHESLCRQTVKDFEWVIVDDGSSDNTREVVDRLIATNTVFPITYKKQANGGKHRAINSGAKIANGDLFFIVDSDDYLSDDAIEKVIEWSNGLPTNKKWAGVAGQKGSYISNRAIGSTFSETSFVDCTSAERNKYHITGDKAEVIFTDVLRKFPFPEIDCENFMTENVMWLTIARSGYKIRWYNDIIYWCEYLPGGLSDNFFRLRDKNPMGYLLSYKIEYKAYRSLRQKLAAANRYYELAKKLNWDNKKISRESSINRFTFLISRIAKKIFGKRD